jgi:hypothetical protein
MYFTYNVTFTYNSFSRLFILIEKTKTLLNPCGPIWFPKETISWTSENQSFLAHSVSKHTPKSKHQTPSLHTITQKTTKPEDAEIQISAATNSILISLAVFSSSPFLCSTKLCSTQWRRRRSPKPGQISHAWLIIVIV